MLNFDPKESVGFLVGRVAHALHLQVQEFLDESGIEITAEEISLLTILAHIDQPESIKQLANYCGKNSTTVSRQVTALEKANLLERSPCSNDARAFVISITSKGRQLVKSTIPMTLALRNRAMKGIPASERKTLQKALQSMLANLQD